MKATKQENENQSSQNNLMTTDLSALDSVKIFINIVAPIILFISGTTIWQSLNELGLSHLFLATIKSDATFLLISVFLLVTSYVLASYILLVILSLILLYHKGKSLYHIPIILTLVSFILILIVTWLFFKWHGVKLTLITSYIIMVIYFYIARTSKQLEIPNKTFSTKNFLIALVALTLVFTLPLTFSQSIGKQFIIRMASFSQLPSNASWYVLDEDYIRRFKLKQQLKINNITTNQLLNLKERFARTTQDSKSYLSSTDLPYQQHPNTLYGYFLWNVGETRVFCPDYFNLKELKKPYYKAIVSNCLIIKERFIEPSVGIQ
ncbi:hypothetical protein [Oligella urethralis]|uniref:hypothetical protein n=1 Tax=Oligella urethralis TaxID=90245 RepID=UPI0006615F14|nr:hypothetical protein [Oligella urethralis]